MSFEEVLGVKTAAVLMRRVQFHYTPYHASWLSMAEIEIGVLQRQCLARCAAEQTTFRRKKPPFKAASKQSGLDRCACWWIVGRCLTCKEKLAYPSGK